MPNINWTATAVVIAAVVPFLNSWFQHWLKIRSENQNAAASPALAQPKAKTHPGIRPVGASRFITRRGFSLLVVIQVLGGMIALNLGEVALRSGPLDLNAWISIVLSMFTFVSLQTFPWILHRFPAS